MLDEEKTFKIVCDDDAEDFCGNGDLLVKLSAKVKRKTLGKYFLEGRNIVIDGLPTNWSAIVKLAKNNGYKTFLYSNEHADDRWFKDDNLDHVVISG